MESIKEGLKRMDQIQNKAVSEYLKYDKATIVAHTGIGKTFIFFKALYALRDKGIPLSSILFLAEVQDREFDLLKNAEAFEKVYNKNPYDDFHIEFMCYQTAYKIKGKTYAFVCADEIHFAMSPEYSKFFKNNKINKLLGITATLEGHIKYFAKTKQDFINEIAPVCFEYDINDGRDNKTFRDLEVYVIRHKFSTEKTIEKKSKTGKFYVSEEHDYKYWTKRYVQALQDNELHKIKEYIIRKRARMIYNSQSRKKLLAKLVSKLEKSKEKTLVFANSLDVLHEVVPATISSRNKPEKNTKFREMFEKGKITLLGSFKKLKQGANLPMLKNIVIHSYYSSGGDLVQRIGRARLAPDSARIFIFLNPDTVELDWFTGMMKDLDVEPIFVDNIDQIKGL